MRLQAAQLFEQGVGARRIATVLRVSTKSVYIIWRNNHAYDERLRRIIAKANAA